MTGFDIQHAMFQVYGIAGTRDMYDVDSLSFGALVSRVSRFLKRTGFHTRGTS
jgi:hypothetical protein